MRIVEQTGADPVRDRVGRAAAPGRLLPSIGGALARGWRSLILRSLTGSALVLAACSAPEPGEVEESPFEPPPREAQSDFLDIGKQAGIEWLSFVPGDQREYPELFEGLDRDQKRRLRLAPLERPNERVLIEFKLPAGSKLWPVEWYGTELMAIELPGAPGFSVAIAKEPSQPGNFGEDCARRRAASNKNWFHDTIGADIGGGKVVLSNGPTVAAYFDRPLKASSAPLRVVVEVYADGAPLSADQVAGARDILAGISIRRELAVEGLPKHRCSSTLSQLGQGKLVFPGGTLNLPLQDGQFARKIGGESTVQVDGEGARPWLLLRRLKESSAQGDIRARVRTDTTFARRVEKPTSRFSAGRRLENASPYIVLWDYSDMEAEQQAVGVIAAGTELLTFEIVSHGLREGESRRKARDAALALLAGATGDKPAGQPLKVLEGWNVGTMGREK